MAAARVARRGTGDAVKPAPFDYAAPTDLDEALRLLADEPGEARALAGGQSLIPMLNFRLAAPDVLVDLGGIAELTEIDARPDGGLRLGAMVCQRELERDPRVHAVAPLLAEGAPWIAHPQIRSRGTVGGSVAHADPAAELPAMLLVLGATVRTARVPRSGEEGGRVTREIPLDAFYLGPFFTVLDPEEIITAIDIPVRAPGEGTAFEEVARRRGDYAIAGVAVRINLGPGGVCEDAALAVINAAPAPTLCGGVATALVGASPGPETIAAAAAAAAEECEPAADMHGSVAYRRHLVGVLAERTLSRAAARAVEETS